MSLSLILQYIILTFTLAEFFHLFQHGVGRSLSNRYSNFLMNFTCAGSVLLPVVGLRILILLKTVIAHSFVELLFVLCAFTNCMY